MVSSQVIIIQYGGFWFATAALTADQWMWCLFFGLGGLLWGQVSRISVAKQLNTVHPVVLTTSSVVTVHLVGSISVNE